MTLLVVLLILALVLFGAGFAINVLWYVAVAVLILAGISYLVGGRRRSL